MRSFDPSKARAVLVAAGGFKSVQLDRGDWMARTEGNAVLLSTGGASQALTTADGSPTMLLTDFPVWFALKRGSSTVNLTNTSGVDVLVFFAPEAKGK